MGICTLLTSKLLENRHLFAGGSTESTMKIFGPSFWFILIVFLTTAPTYPIHGRTVLVTILFRKKILLLTSVFFILFNLWFFSGRTIGVHWTGEVSTGWFYLRTNKIFLCENIIENTEVIDSNLFYLKFVNKTTLEKRIFVGPIVYQDIKNYFNRIPPSN